MRANNVFVTDNASNMKAAIREYTWIGCACHNLNLVLTHGFSRKGCSATAAVSEEEGEHIAVGIPVEVLQVIDTCKEIMALAKRTHLNAVLETTLKQSVVTRWNSTLTTLKSVSTNLDELHSLTSVPGGSRNLLRLVVYLNDSLLREVVQILEPFDTATKCLSTDKSPTMHLVVPTKVQLSKQLSPSPSDSVIMSQLKEHLQKKLELYFTSVLSTSLPHC